MRAVRVLVSGFVLCGVVAACSADSASVPPSGDADGGSFGASADGGSGGSGSGGGGSAAVPDGGPPAEGPVGTDGGVCATAGCSADATCTQANGAAPVCSCKAGFTGDGKTCSNIDDCKSNPCANGGTCTDGVDDFTCACVAGFNGKTCSNDVDDCAPNPCKNGGTCTDGVNAFTCACAPGYSGATCATNVDECAPNPCMNGGVCTDGIDDFTCACPAGYTGKTCATNVDECAPNPCTNGGTCTDGVDDFTCACPAGYSGKTCNNNVDECAPNPCKNGGTCTDRVNDFTCACAAGYSGKTCATNIDDCAPNPCKNGGACTDGANAFTCACAPGYSGATCATNIDDCASNPCKNGGACTDLVNDFSCACAPGFVGKDCTTSLNLLAHYKFDEGAGTTAVDSAGGNNGEHTGTYVAGKKGTGALRFTNPQAPWGVRAANAPSWGDANADYTVGYWVKLTTINSTGHAATFHKTSAADDSTLRWPADYFQFNSAVIVEGMAVVSNRFFNSSPTPAFSLGTWTHFAAVHAGNQQLIYIDGALQQANTLPSATVGGPGILYLGGSKWFGRFYGELDDVRVYGRALTQAQIVSQML